MADKKLSGKEFVKKLEEKAKNKPLLRRASFVIVAETVEEGDVENTSITVVKKEVPKVLCSFNYDSNGLIYNMSFGGMSFNELCELTDMIREITDY